jgi:hypothetical protein
MNSLGKPSSIVFSRHFAQTAETVVLLALTNQSWFLQSGEPSELNSETITTFYIFGGRFGLRNLVSLSIAAKYIDPDVFGEIQVGSVIFEWVFSLPAFFVVCELLKLI